MHHWLSKSTWLFHCSIFQFNKINYIFYLIKYETVFYPKVLKILYWVQFKVNGTFEIYFFKEYAMVYIVTDYLDQNKLL